MSWGGLIYDATIVLFLLYPVRKLAYVAVLGFHLMTFLLFDIGMFPLIMIVLTTIFFEPNYPRRFLKPWQRSVNSDPVAELRFPQRLTGVLLAYGAPSTWSFLFVTSGYRMMSCGQSKACAIPGESWCEKRWGALPIESNEPAMDGCLTLIPPNIFRTSANQ